MAQAITPDSLIKENAGSLNLVIAKFANTLDTGDTWESGLVGIVAHWAIATDVPVTQTNSGLAVAESSGTFTFSPDEDNQAVTLFVLVRS